MPRQFIYQVYFGPVSIILLWKEVLKLKTNNKPPSSHSMAAFSLSNKVQWTHHGPAAALSPRREALTIVQPEEERVKEWGVNQRDSQESFQSRCVTLAWTLGGLWGPAPFLPMLFGWSFRGSGPHPPGPGSCWAAAVPRWLRGQREGTPRGPARPRAARAQPHNGPSTSSSRIQASVGIIIEVHYFRNLPEQQTVAEVSNLFHNIASKGSKNPSWGTVTFLRYLKVQCSSF